jgi:hypothetical protein
MFHCDHLHPQHCPCPICEADPSLRKLTSISMMAFSRDWKSWTDQQLEAELLKVRLMHTDCHLRHTRAEKHTLLHPTRSRTDATEAEGIPDDTQADALHEERPTKRAKV